MPIGFAVFGSIRSGALVFLNRLFELLSVKVIGVGLVVEGALVVVNGSFVLLSV